MPGIAADLCARQNRLEDERNVFDRSWREVAQLCSPIEVDLFADLGYWRNTDKRMVNPSGSQAQKTLYDSTGRFSLDRFGAAMESLITPRGAFWHTLRMMHENELIDDAGQRWLEDVASLMFTIRYGGKAQFASAIGEVYRSVGAFGNSWMYVAEDFGDSPISYRTRPVAECWAQQNHRGYVDVIFRRFRMTARACVQQFGDRTPAAIAKDAEDPQQTNKLYGILHAVLPREEAGSTASGRNEMPFASYYVWTDETMLIGDGGYEEFPYIDFRLTTFPDQVYAEGPAMLVLSDMKTAQVTMKTTLRAAQKAVDPPMGIPSGGTMGRPNFDPGKITSGAIDAQGRQIVKPLNTGANPGLGMDFQEVQRRTIERGFYIDLFAILTQNPSMTATEAMIRAQEKAQMLGPAGGRLQNSLARLIDREFGILRRKGFFRGDGIYPVPPSIAGRQFEAEFQSPLDRARRAAQGAGTLRMIELANVMAATGQLEGWENIDKDASFRGLAEIEGMPTNFLVAPLERDEARARKLEAQAAQARMNMVTQAAEAAGAAAPAVTAVSEVRNG